MSITQSMHVFRSVTFATSNACDFLAIGRCRERHHSGAPLAFNCNITNYSHMNPDISACMELPVGATAFFPLVCSKRSSALYLHRVDGFYSRSLFLLAGSSQADGLMRNIAMDDSIGGS